MTRQHSDFSASASKRLLECPASYRETKRLGVTGRSSKYAAEGTAAHDVAEGVLKDPEAIPDFGRWLGSIVDTKRKVDNHEITIDRAMADHVKGYIELVHMYESMGFQISVEQRVSPSWLWNPGRPPIELYGFADVIGWDPVSKTLAVIDFKYGAGVPVEVPWNPQFLYYALGAMREIEVKGEQVQTIATVVHQPRAPHPDGATRDFKYTRSQVVDWGMYTLMPGVEQVVDTTQPAPYAVGSWCQFCPVLSKCPEIGKRAQDAARQLMANNPPADPLHTRMGMADVLEPWIEAVRAEAHQALETRQSVPGYKLVDKRAKRTWSDEKAVNNLLVQAGRNLNLPVLDYTNVEIKSPAQILAIPAIKSDPAILQRLQSFVTKTSSGTTVVPDTDPRPAVIPHPSAQDVFNVDAEENETKSNG